LLRKKLATCYKSVKKRGCHSKEFTWPSNQEEKKFLRKRGGRSISRRSQRGKEAFSVGRKGPRTPTWGWKGGERFRK